MSNRAKQLVEEFCEHAASRGRAVDRNNSRKANASFDAMISTYQTMRRELGEPVAAIVPLAEDPNPWVALPASFLLLEHYPDVAIPSLERLSKSANPELSLNAELTLKEYRAGRLRFPTSSPSA